MSSFEMTWREALNDITAESMPDYTGFNLKVVKRLHYSKVKMH